MSKVDWSLAPKWADHVVSGPLSGINYWANDERRIQFGGEFDYKDNNHVNECWKVIEGKPKPWSGPEDGLPPLGVEFEWRYGDMEWKKGEALYIGEIYIILKSIHGGEQHYYLRDMKFRVIPTPDQKRETAIREVMDIAQVDCRVTAARLVDAGFKREVV